MREEVFHGALRFSVRRDFGAVGGAKLRASTDRSIRPGAKSICEARFGGTIPHSMRRLTSGA